MYEFTSGDVNVAYGALFLAEDRADTWRHGYVEAVRVDEMCDGLVAIQHIVILPDAKRIVEAMESWSHDPESFVAEFQQGTRKDVLAEMLAGYGHYDPDDDWDGYRSYHTEFIQTAEDEPMVSCEGCKADKRVLEDDLPGYLAAVHHCTISKEVR